MILALETATNVCSVALANRSGSIFEKRYEEHGSHSEQLFLFVESLMEEHQFKIPDLEAVLISEGPGSYTGLRIGASAVKGLLFQTDVSLFAIDTLASFAMSTAGESSPETTIHSIIDARRVHVYHQQFVADEKGFLQSEDKAQVIPIEAFETMVSSGDHIVGTGINRLSEEVVDKSHIWDERAITAAALIRLYRAEQHDFITEVDPASYDPNYYSSTQVQQ